MSSTPSSALQPVRSRLRSPRFIVMFLALSMLFALGQFHRSSGGVLAPIFVEELMLNAKQIGLAMGAMFLAQGFIQLPSAILIDRYGPRIIVSTMSLLSVAGCFVIAVADSWSGIFIGRALLGLGFAASLLSANTIFVNWGSIELIATLTGRYLFVGGIGAICATFPLAYLIELSDLRSVFSMLGVATIVVALPTYIFTRDFPDTGTKEPGEDAVRSKKTLRGSIKGLGMVLKDRRIWPALATALFMYSPLQITIGLWAGPFLKDVHHIPAIDRSYMLLIMAFGMVIGMPIIGPIERFFNTRRTVILVCTSLIAATFLALAAFGYAHLWLAVLLFTLISLLSSFFIVILAHGQALFPPEYAGRVVSLFNLFGITGIFVVQYATGFIISAVTDDPNVTGSVLGYRLVFGMMTVTFIIVTVIYSRMRDIPPRVKILAGASA